MRAIKRRLAGALFGRRALQPLWLRLHRLSLAGMNIGAAADHPGTSGEARLLESLARGWSREPFVTVFDVGSHAGEYASCVLGRLGERARLYCFEPSRGSFERLRSSLAGRPNAQLFELGLGDERGSQTLYGDAAGSGGASLYERRLEHLDVSFAPLQEVKVDTLDDFCEERGIDRIHLLKLDVEGHELRVLRGAQRLLANGAVDCIQFEFGGTDIDSRTFFQDFFHLLDPGFRLHRVLKDGLAPIDVYDEALEIFVTTNFCAFSRGTLVK